MSLASVFLSAYRSVFEDGVNEFHDTNAAKSVRANHSHAMHDHIEKFGYKHSGTHFKFDDKSGRGNETSTYKHPSGHKIEVNHQSGAWRHHDRDGKLRSEGGRGDHKKLTSSVSTLRH